MASNIDSSEEIEGSFRRSQRKKSWVQLEAAHLDTNTLQFTALFNDGDVSKKSVKRKSEDPIGDAKSAKTCEEDAVKQRIARAQKLEALNIHLADFSKKIQKESKTALLAQYREIDETADRHPFTTVTASQPINRSRNRYPDILPFDHSLVMLAAPVSDPPAAEAAPAPYINASVVNIPGAARCYIATQGPLSTTLETFWQMIWEHHCELIVMLTRESEGDRVKCAQYWPEAPASSGPAGQPPTPGRPSSGALKFGALLVAHVATTLRGNTVERQFTLKCGAECRRVKHLQYLEWPDKEVPEPASFLEFWRSFDVAATDRSRTGTGPIVVHCSAGIGRTGTFIGLDLLAGVLRQGAPRVSVENTVAALRKCRLKMVQTGGQYVFLHQCLHSVIEQEIAKATAGEEATGPIPLPELLEEQENIYVDIEPAAASKDAAKRRRLASSRRNIGKSSSS